MKKEITLGSLLSILVPIFVLLIGWSISINTRLATHDELVKANKEDIGENRMSINKVDDKIDKNFKIIQEKLDRILINEINRSDKK